MRRPISLEAFASSELFQINRIFILFICTKINEFCKIKEFELLEVILTPISKIRNIKEMCFEDLQFSICWVKRKFNERGKIEAASGGQENRATLINVQMELPHC